MCDDTNCGKCSTDKVTCTECNDGFGLDGATCAGKFLILGNYLLPTIHFNVVVLLVYELGVDITTCAGKFLMLRYGLFPTIYDKVHMDSVRMTHPMEVLSSLSKYSIYFP